MFFSISASVLILATAFSAQVNAGDITVPAGNIELLRVHAKGTQNYACQNGAFVFQNPNATLFLTQKLEVPIGKHFFLGAPDSNGGKVVFKLNHIDESFVVFKGIGNSTSPFPHAVPQLLLQTTSTSGAGGIMSAVTYGQRLNTIGGVPDSMTCTGDESVKVPYRADYVFYTAQTAADTDATTEPPAGSKRCIRRPRSAN